jgi:preprotein translocase subunit YajC
MTDMPSMPHVFALGAPAPGQSVLVSMFPLVAMLVIFYFLILMPMRKKQKKVEEFRTGLKVGDKVVTTGGIYGQVTRITDVAVQLQIADKVRIDVARAAIGGYQGKEPVVQQESGGL